LGLSAAVVSLGKKLYSHYLSHPAVKPGKYCVVCNLGTAEKQLSIADVVIPVEKSQKRKNYSSTPMPPMLNREQTTHVAICNNKLGIAR